MQKKQIHKMKAIKAWAVVCNCLGEYFTYDNRGGDFFAHAIFHSKKEALEYGKNCSTRWNKPKIKVIPVIIHPLKKGE